MLIEVGKCGVCTKAMFAAPGQIVRFHGGCRKEGKKKFGRSSGVNQFEINEFGSLVPVAKSVIVK